MPELTCRCLRCDAEFPHGQGHVCPDRVGQRIVPPKGGSGTAPPFGRRQSSCQTCGRADVCRCFVPPASTVSGWQCPGCHGCYAPAVTACPNCRPDVMQQLRSAGRVET